MAAFEFNTVPRASLKQRFEDGRWDDEEEWDLIENDLSAEDAIAIGFRHHAPATQKHQDRVLVLYYNYIKKHKKLPLNEEDDIVMPLAFPADEDVLIAQCRR